jgi:hypothetical protein
MKQDRQGARTVTDIERRYGTRFSEIMGIADDAREAANEANEAVKNLDENLSQDELFARLTNNGQAQGLFRDEDGNIYINASYLAGGVIQSSDGKVQISLDGSLPIFNTGISTNGLIVRGDVANAPKLVEMTARETILEQYPDTYYIDILLRSVTGAVIGRFTETFDEEAASGVATEIFSQNGKNRVLMAARDPYSGIQLKYDDVVIGAMHSTGAGHGEVAVWNHGLTREAMLLGEAERAGLWVKTADQYVGGLIVDETGKSSLTVNKINGKNVSWKDNGDGTYTLIGTD